MSDEIKANTVNAGSACPASHAYDIVLDELTKAVREDLFHYFGNVLAHSSKILARRNSIVANIANDSSDIAKHVEAAPAGLLETICSRQLFAAKERKRLEDELEAHKGNGGGNGAKRSSDSLDQIHAFAKAEKRYDAMVEELGEKQELFYIILPVKTDSYTGVRIVLPIDASSGRGLSNLDEYAYLLLNTELAITFQEQTFEGGLDPSFTRQVRVTDPDGRSFRAIDIEYELQDEPIEDVLIEVADFTMDVLNSPVAHLKKRGVEIPNLHNELLQANLVMKPLVFPLKCNSFIKEYFDANIRPEVDALCDGFKEFLMFKVGDEVPSEIKERVISSSLEHMLSELPPYREKLEGICSKHLKPLLAGLYARLINANDYEIQTFSNASADERGSPESVWITREEAERIFPGVPPVAKEWLDLAIESGAVSVRTEGQRELIPVSDMLALRGKIAYNNDRFIVGVYDEEVVLSGEFYKQHGLDPKKFNRLMKDRVIPIKDHIKSCNRYVLAVANTEEILRIYQENT